MQDTEPTLKLPSTTTKSSSPKNTLPSSTNMSPYTKYGSPPPCSRTTSPCLPSERHNNHHQESGKDDGKYISDDEISVGCPSPRYEERYYNNSGNSAARGSSDCRCPSGDDSDVEEYFRPLKKLKMVSEAPPERRMSSPTVNQESNPESDNAQGGGGPGVKSFSIMDILSHRPAKPQKIVRPWDIEPELTEQEKAQVAHQQNLERFHRQLKAQQQHQLALLRSDLLHATSCYTSETGSDRSSSVTSDCCSPDHLNSSAAVVAAAAAAAAAQRLSLAGVGGSSSGGAGSSSAGQRTKTGPSGTPLDALFQMTSKTFDQNTGEANPDGANHLNLFNNRQQPKKKRKSRTAFTNHQIFELEKRFLYQKYLSPADRDEIASSLGLSNAQVITWFQNRRAKLKRDMEELKKDVENTKILNAHKSFLENVQDLGLLKKKAMMERVERESDCGAKNLVISEK